MFEKLLQATHDPEWGTITVVGKVFVKHDWYTQPPPSYDIPYVTVKGTYTLTKDGTSTTYESTYFAYTSLLLNPGPEYSWYWYKPEGLPPTPQPELPLGLIGYTAAAMSLARVAMRKGWRIYRWY